AAADLRAHAGERGFGSLLLGGEFGGIELRDQVALLHDAAFIDVQLHDARCDARADHHLVGIHSADQLQIGRATDGNKVINDGDDDDEADEHGESASLIHVRSFLACGLSREAEITSSTAARRCAMRADVSGSPPTSTPTNSALEK